MNLIENILFANKYLFLRMLKRGGYIVMIVCCLLIQEKIQAQGQPDSVGIISGVKDKDSKTLVVSADSIDELQTSAKDYADRNKILELIEELRTAYYCKDIYYINSIYRNALIVNHESIRLNPNTNKVERNIKHKGYRYEVQISTKKEYIKKLRMIFKMNKFLNVDFDSIQVDKVRGYRIYGVSFYQRFNSTNMADNGYLFLLVDCQKEDEMQVFFRAWTSEKIFNLNSFSKFEIPSNIAKTEKQ